MFIERIISDERSLEKFSLLLHRGVTVAGGWRSGRGRQDAGFNATDDGVPAG
jgi:hypothetical protein